MKKGEREDKPDHITTVVSICVRNVHLSYLISSTKFL